MHPTAPGPPPRTAGQTAHKKQTMNNAKHKTHQARLQHNQTPSKKQPSPHNSPGQKAAPPADGGIAQGADLKVLLFYSSPCTRGYRGPAYAPGYTRGYRASYEALRSAGVLLPMRVGVPRPASTPTSPHTTAPPTRGGTASGRKTERRHDDCSPSAWGYRVRGNAPGQPAPLLPCTGGTAWAANMASARQFRSLYVGYRDQGDCRAAP